ncbi:unnamed protein product [Pylaiella littoralis]
MSGFACDVCNKAFSTQQSLDQHTRSNPRSHEFKICDECHKTFSTQEALDQHTRSNPRSHFKICDKCDKSFSTQEALDQHTRSNPRSHIIVCDNCRRRFKTLKEKKEHTDSRHMCKVCKDIFCDDIDMAQHQYDMHMNRCTHCGKIFDNKHSAVAHIMANHLESTKVDGVDSRG